MAKKFNIHTEEDAYVAIGLGRITPQQAVSRLKEEYRKKYGSTEPEAAETMEKDFIPQKTVSKTGKGVIIAGIDSMLLRFAKCCTPVPGDKIAGVVTRGRGVSIHRQDCLMCSTILIKTACWKHTGRKMLKALILWK